ncbi:MAG: hypothetical protein LBD93_03010 [Treponema sp.]|jgi:hypothetical protein|nr:hypothetical protein [Treponema sp.]
MMGSISIHDLARVIDYPEQINDPRRRAYGNIRHKPIDLIVIAFTEARGGGKSGVGAKRRMALRIKHLAVAAGLDCTCGRRIGGAAWSEIKEHILAFLLLAGRTELYRGLSSR